MTRPPSQNGAGRVIVRLEDVALDLRLRVADEIVERGKLRGLDALEMLTAARRPRPTRLAVSPEKAEIVLRRGKRPPGPAPKVWQW